MAKTSLKKVAKLMGNIDLCMFTTVDGRGMTASRPMSNNGDVKYNGKSYFFTYAKTKMTRDILKNPHVSLSFIGNKLFSKTFVSVSGKAKVIKDRELMRDHWNKDLEIWFEDGIDTPGIAMIEVEAKHIKYWERGKEAELTL